MSLAVKHFTAELQMKIQVFVVAANVFIFITVSCSHFHFAVVTATWRGAQTTDGMSHKIVQILQASSSYKPCS